LIEATNRYESAVASSLDDSCDLIAPYSDNRFFPGFGAIRFAELFNFLQGRGYSGGLAIEGNTKEDLLSDIRRTVAFLAPQLQSS
jgi:sugar phosphate isomerase/epimerase